MYILEKEVTISSAHHLRGYKGACSRDHGHNWRIVVYCKGEKLDKIGMLVDFGKIKSIVNKLDHQDLNKILSINPTAENLAKYLFDKIPYCYKVMIEESKGSKVYYEKENKDFAKTL